MPNLSPDKAAAIDAGGAIRQTWTIRAPLDAAHSSYADIIIDDGLLPTGTSRRARVVRAGSRSHQVWNPHPTDQGTPKAVRYSIEVANGDGYFFVRDGGVFNLYGLYQAAPAECFLIHKILIQVNGGWQTVPHMDYVGRILEVEYSGSGSMVRSSPSTGTTAPGLAPRSATITAEQVGAWEYLRHVFNKDDGVRTSTIQSFTVAGTRLTLASISPTTRASGTAFFTVTCTGTGFTEGLGGAPAATIYIDDIPKTTTFVSSTSVTATVGAALIVNPGALSIRVGIAGPGGAMSTPQTLTVT